MSVETKKNRPLLASRRDCAIVNLRGNPADSVFAEGVQSALNLSLPAPGSFNRDGPRRLVWVGPDDWFFIDVPGSEGQASAELQAISDKAHCAATDVSGGYSLITLSGPQAKEMLSAGCPLDLRAGRFDPGSAAGTVYFKAAIRLWMLDAEPRYELLVRRSFEDYFWQLLERSCQECGLQRQDLV